MRLYNSSLKLCLLASIAVPHTLPGQAEVARLQHVRWPLMDLVILPDSGIGIWLLVAPSKGTEQWHGGASVVSLAIEPVTTFQWVMVARKLLGDTSSAAQPGVMHLTPPLRGSCGPAFVLLARNPKKKAGRKEAFVFLVSDSASHAQWKTFASAEQVEDLLTSVEQTAWEQEKWTRPSRSSGDADSADAPVEVVSQPAPKYPEKLIGSGREARVWTSYIVDSTGQPERNSFRVLLSDGQEFTEEALAALSQGDFKPARLRGRPVSQRVFQVVSFRQR